MNNEDELKEPSALIFQSNIPEQQRQIVDGNSTNCLNHSKVFSVPELSDNIYSEELKNKNKPSWECFETARVNFFNSQKKQISEYLNLEISTACIIKKKSVYRSLLDKDKLVSIFIVVLNLQTIFSMCLFLQRSITCLTMADMIHLNSGPSGNNSNVVRPIQNLGPVAQPFTLSRHKKVEIPATSTLGHSQNFMNREPADLGIPYPSLPPGIQIQNFYVNVNLNNVFIWKFPYNS